MLLKMSNYGMFVKERDREMSVCGCGCTAFVLGHALIREIERWRESAFRERKRGCACACVYCLE